MSDIGQFADVPVEIGVELARRTMTLRDILRLAEGSVMRLTRSAGENLDLYVGDVLFGTGEVVMIENSVAVRLTDFKG